MRILFRFLLMTSMQDCTDLVFLFLMDMLNRVVYQDCVQDCFNPVKPLEFFLTIFKIIIKPRWIQSEMGAYGFGLVLSKLMYIHLNAMWVSMFYKLSS